MPENSNDNDGPDKVPHPEPDAHGQAALLLIESLLHGLIARETISVEEAVEIVNVAAEVKAEVGVELGDSPATMRRSLALLASISLSLEGDMQGG